MKIKYVGVKEDGETAFCHLSGVERWMPGDSHEVKNSVAVRMLSHPDVFALDDQGIQSDHFLPNSAGWKINANGIAELANAIVDPKALTLAPGVKVEAAKVETSITVNGAVTVLDGLDKDALHALAKELNVPVHFKSGPPKVIAALQAAFPAAAE